MHETSLFDHVHGQLGRLCAVTGADPVTAAQVLRDLWGSEAPGARSERAPWSSGVSDDHTPVEFSLAFHRGERPTLRILAEALAASPAPRARLAAGHAFIRAQAARHGLSLAAFDRVRDLFLPDDPRDGFGLWQSLVFPPRRRPEFKVYLDPEISGVDRSPELVGAALGRLGLGASYSGLIDRAARPGELSRLVREALEHHRVRMEF